MQGNRLSCRDQEGRRGSEEAVPGPSVFPSRETRHVGVKAQHEGALPPPCIVRKDLRVPHTARRGACLHVASSTSNGSFQPFQGFSELLDTLSVALSCLESSIVGSSFVNPGSSQAPLPQPFQHFQYWGSSRHCSQLSSLYSLPPSLRPLIPHPQGPQLPLVF